VRADRSESFAAMYADGSTKTLDSWQDSERRTAASFGAGIVAAMEWRISHGWSMDVLGGYDWVSRNVDLAIGPNTVTLDASGFTLGMMLNYWF